MAPARGCAWPSSTTRCPRCCCTGRRERARLLRREIEAADTRLLSSGRRTILFVDEIHRFNRSQQDALLHAVENRTVVLIGATTENPFFEVNSALISRSASLLAHKGIVLCNSAGNSGMNSWKKIGVPADADNILTVGAVSSEGKIAPFSSVGPSQDLRVKPDVVAMGSPATLISGKGMLTRDMGTSFSTPLISGLVACLWQGLPGKTALEIIDLVRQSATLCEEPDNVYGYGVPDFWRAYMVGKMQDEK